MSKGYKNTFILLKVEAERPKDILQDALNEYIHKLQKNIELYSSGKNGSDARITVCAERMNQAMEWRDKMALLGSDTIYSASGIDEFKTGLAHIY